MNHTKQKAFTLVELIVVVTILAILATIGFVSYSSYLTGVRDTNRLAQLVSIHDGLELYRTEKDLPLPDESVEVQTNGEIIAYQGYAGSNTLETIDFTKGGKDPRDGEYFSYYLTDDRKYFQLMGFLEEESNITTSLYEGGKISLLSKTQAVDYSNRFPAVYGKKLGILTNTENAPIQEVISGQIDLGLDDTTDYIAHLSDISTLTGSTVGNGYIKYIQNTNIAGGLGTSCKTFLDKNGSLKGEDGIYLIAIDGEVLPVYCDMTLDGGGWTMFSKNGGSGTQAGAPAAGSINYGILDMSDSDGYSINIHDFNITGIMGMHFTTGDFVQYDDINGRLLIEELKDTAGETSANTDAQTDLGTSTLKSSVNGVTFEGKTDITIFEVHRGGWDATSNTNWILASEDKGAGTGANYIPNSISSIGYMLIDNDGLLLRMDTGNYGLFFR